MKLALYQNKFLYLFKLKNIHSMRLTIRLILLSLFFSCSPKKDPAKELKVESKDKTPFLWENATVYFLMTDRFSNGDPSNDQSFNRKPDGAVLRSFMGGDIQGIIQKIEEGYFNDLGVNAIWFTPVFEQVKGFTDEGTGKTYAYHGYWIRDWTSIDPNFGSFEQLRELVDTAHEHGIRVLMDVVLNHTGPVTAVDPQWPDAWVRTSPTCTYKDFETTVTCTLVDNLPDIRTESDQEVELPNFLREKWQEEGRLDREMAELDDFFTRTGLPRAARFYIIKWLVDYVRELGIDGFRVDTAKHTEPSVWQELYKEALAALKAWKNEHPAKKPDDEEFFMVGEVYGYSIHHGQDFPMGPDTVNFFREGFKSLINFSFKEDAGQLPEEVFSNYSQMLHHGELQGLSVLNYISSHDDASPLDRMRNNVLDGATKLMLAPGAVQIYYGDETSRLLKAEGAEGDANLRTFMNWNALESDSGRNGYRFREVLEHWQKLGRFRQEHPAVGAGVHRKLKDTPYTFERRLTDQDYEDKVLVVWGATGGTIDVSQVFQDGTALKDYYSGEEVTVKNKGISLRSASSLILLGEPR